VVEKISAQTPADVTVTTGQELQELPGIDLDDRLRDIPGFTLYKRASSVVANPTTQGVSLRGLGSSGASRTLMLWDGIPANDPFGGWVYWTGFIPDEIDRVEVSRGAATSVFGNLAMSGAIAAFTGQPQAMHLTADYETGSQDTQDVSLGFSNLWGGWAISGMARAFDTDGYYIVPASIRGPVDWKAGVRFVTGDVHADWFGVFGNLFFKTDLLAEDRANGTELTHNSTGLGTAALHYVRQWKGDSLSLLGYHTREGFHSTFSSVSANRQTEKLTYRQTVPSQASGGAALWQHHEARWDLTGGTDLDRISGTDTDRLVPTGVRIGGGVQFEKGVFGQGDFNWDSLRLFAGARESFVAAGERFFSPSAGAAWGQKRLRLRGSLYRAFRAPTLNELYRSFSVGNTFTEANPALRPETVFGAETGVDWAGESSSVRLTAFRNSLDNLITNVTLSSSATAIVRERENAADAVSRGAEAAFHKQWRSWTGDLNYLFVDSRYATGYRIAEVPKHQGTAQLAYRKGGAMASVEVRSFDYQFDDDLNQYRLPGYATVQVMVRQRLAKSLSAEVGVENALNRVFYTAFTPTPNIGEPRLWRVGLKWEGKVR
jgi:outer membrane cobalamin receptor